MRLVNDFFYALGKVDTKLPMEVKLQRCLDLGIPVLIKVPNGFEVWAVDVQLNRINLDDVILSENDFGNQIELKNHFFEDEPFCLHRKPRIKTSYLAASTLLSDVECLQLLSSDIEKLKKSENVSVDNFERVMIFDENGFTLQESVPVPSYRFKLDPSDEKTPVGLYLQKLKFPNYDLNFVLCDQDVVFKNEFNFPIGHKHSHAVSATECLIMESDVSKLVFNDVEYEKSIYHLEPEYHVSSSFLDLSKAGFELFIKNISIVSGGNSGYLRRNYPRFDKKNLCEGGAFWINPKPRKHLKGEGCQFHVLKKVFDECWLPEIKLTKKEARIISENVIRKLTQENEVNEDYIKAAELIIRPDKYKK